MFSSSPPKVLRPRSLRQARAVGLRNSGFKLTLDARSPHARVTPVNFSLQGGASGAARGRCGRASARAGLGATRALGTPDLSVGLLSRFGLVERAFARAAQAGLGGLPRPRHRQLGADSLTQHLGRVLGQPCLALQHRERVVGGRQLFDVVATLKGEHPLHDDTGRRLGRVVKTRRRCLPFVLERRSELRCADTM